MLEVGTDRNIAVVDIDGVLLKTPVQETVNDVDFWAHHWNDPDSAVPRPEMIGLVQALMQAGWHIILLTARPDIFRDVTVEFLYRVGLTPLSPKAEFLIGGHHSLGAPALVMLPTQDNISFQHNWKADTIRGWVDAGAKIQFMIEDYKPNAEAIRKIVPVLLYEQVR